MATAVDAGDFVIPFADHEPAAVVFFLEAVAVVGEQAGYVGLLDGVEELATDAAVEPLPA
jgi:hypothetical protein